MEFSSQLIKLDLFFVLERLLPGKRSLALLREQHKFSPVTTLSLSHCDNAAALQLALYRYCRNYSAIARTRRLDTTFLFTGTEAHTLAATQALTSFIRSSLVWVEHYIELPQKSWTMAQHQTWLFDFKLLVQTIIGIGNCTNAAWFIQNQTVIKTLCYSTHLQPFLQHYE